jgi:hypothetical protein
MPYMTKLNKSARELYAAQDSLLQKVFGSRADLFGDRPVILAGGTALARFYLEHRVSYDLDFFVDGEFHPERLLKQLERQEIRLDDISMVAPGGTYATQLHGYAKTAHGYPVKISFVEDFLAGSFDTVKVGQGVLTEEVSGLYCRKLRTIAGAGQGETATGAPTNIGGRQTARDLFDIYVLSQDVQPLWEFVEEINQFGGNLSEEAVLRGLHDIPWKDLMDELDQMERLRHADITLFDIKRYFDESYSTQQPGR